MAESLADVDRAEELLTQGDIAGAFALVETAARRYEGAIFAWGGKDLQAAELAGFRRNPASA